MTYPMTYLYLGCFALQAVLAAVVWLATPGQPVRWPVVAIMVFGAFWALADLLANLAESAEQMRLFLHIFVFSWVLIPYLLLRAALAYTGHRRVLWSVPWNAVLLLPAAGIAYLTWSNRLFVDFVPAGIQAPYFHSVSSSWQVAVDIYYFGYVVLAGTILVRAARQTGRRELARAVRLVFWAALPAVIIGLLFNGGLFFTELFTPFVGSVVMAGACAFLAVGILRRDFLTPLFTAQLDYQALLRTSPDGITITDLEGRFVMVNQKAVETIGYDTVEEFLGNHRNAFEFLVQADIPSAAGFIAEVVQTGAVARFEYRVRRRDGTKLPVEASVGLLRGDDGEPRGLISITRDLTERKEAESERRRLEAQIQHAQKLESMGILAGGIAHDFNNLLVGVLGNASLAKQGISADSVAWHRIHQIEVAAQRAAGLTREMLAYSGRGKFVIEPLDLSALVSEITRLLEVSISKKIEVAYEFAAELPAVRGDASQLQQVIMNLITNASDAIGDRQGRIELDTRRLEVAADELIDSSSAEPVPAGRYVCLRVSDTGCGMDANTQRNIFDPFFTTKFTGRGLGLAVVQGIVRGHEGAILVESTEGQGSIIQVLLPCAIEAPSGTVHRLTPAPLAKGDWSGSGLVLIVDDEELVREVATLALERVGFTVLTAHDGAEGVRLFTEHLDEITGVILDLTMPKMDGTEALMRMRELRADVPVVIISGYTEEEASTCFDANDTTLFVHKPFSPVELVGALCSTLGAATRG